MIAKEFNEHVHTLAFQLPKEGKSCCGDSFYIKTTDSFMICALADGLGSGEGANESSAAISSLVEQNFDEDVDVLMRLCNEELKDKRGATVSILKVDFPSKSFTYSSVGNIRFMLYGPSGAFIYPLPILGYLSGKPQKYRTQTYSYEKGSKFIIYTDGLVLPGIKALLNKGNSVEDLSRQLDIYTKKRTDDLTYIVGQLF
ncbi:PP2C family serine/threonine-protein phosphatase [Metabacillus halosaccharovorans]|uniref:PP2C family serine/threonine-protein phosphatase n=1 Tax=Metabacillus halosaccharovorans TaxID=930124 RepID=UPI001C1F4994|nr:PP2C family serine/threonine-protein phosphatase [Metabacillus halosaccharovorans]MBU7596034.1 SpoIIE family protein phosphatase [Metabacillus halosaccharovorans]